MISATTEHITFEGAADFASAPVRPRNSVTSLAAVLILLGILTTIGCSRRADSPSPGPASPTVGSSGSGLATIKADPNPVPAGPDKFGKTTVTWDTGDGSIGEVYVSVNGQPEKLFAGNRTKGSLEAPWIGKGEHEFRLYRKEPKSVMASVMVTRQKK
jgi:hypothetical protein